MNIFNQQYLFSVIVSAFMLFISLMQGQKKENATQTVKQIVDMANAKKFDDWPVAEKLLKKAKNKTEEGDESTKAYFYKTAAVIYYDRDIFDTAIRYNSLAYNYYKKHNLLKAAEVENLQAIIYARLNNKKEALEHFRNVYRLSRHKDDFLSAKALNNIGTIFLNSDRADSAMIYYRKVLEIKLKDRQAISLKVITYNNIARTLCLDRKFPEAANAFYKAKSLLKAIQDPSIKAQTFNNLSEYFMMLKKADSAIYYAEKAKTNSKVYSSFQNRDILKNLYQAYMMKGDDKRAVKYFQQYDDLRDSLNIEEKAVFLEKQKIETEYRNREHQLEMKNSRSRQNLIIAVLGLICLILILTIFLIRYKNHLLNEKLQRELSVSHEKELGLELELKNKQLISKSLLETEKNEMYHSLTKDLERIQKGENLGAVRNELNTVIMKLNRNVSPTNWEEFDVYFTSTYNSFYDQLTTKHSSLNHNDKKLCALIRMGLNTKEIAGITNTSVKSVENSRTRLRKKLNLTNKKQDLYEYLSLFK